jgi:hypothetical protein
VVNKWISKDEAISRSGDVNELMQMLGELASVR